MKKIRSLLIWLPLAVVGLLVITFALSRVVPEAVWQELSRFLLGVAVLSWIVLIPCAYIYAKATGRRAAGWMLGVSVPVYGLR